MTHNAYSEVAIDTAVLDTHVKEPGIRVVGSDWSALLCGTGWILGSVNLKSKNNDEIPLR